MLYKQLQDFISSNLTSMIRNNTPIQQILLAIHLAQPDVDTSFYINSAPNLLINGALDDFTSYTNAALEENNIVFLRMSSLSRDRSEIVSQFLQQEWLPNNPHFNFLNYLSMSLQSRGSLVRIYQSNGKFLVIFSLPDMADSARLEWYHKLLVGIAMQLYMHNPAFIKASTDYLTGSVNTFIYPSELVSEMELYKEQLVTEVYRQHISNLLDIVITNAHDNDAVLLDLQNEIDQAEHALSQLLIIFKQKSFEQFLIKESEYQDRNDILEYITRVHRDKIIGVATATNARFATLDISLRAPMIFSQDIAAYIANPSRNYLIDRAPHKVQLLKDINDKLVKVYLYGTIRIKLPCVSNGEISGYPDIVYFTDAEREKYQYQVVLNDHIAGHDCFTEAKSNIRKYLTERKYEAMFDQMVYAVGSVNPYDGATMPDTLSNLFNRSPHNVVIEKRTESGWQTMTLEEYYNETIQANQRANG